MTATATNTSTPTNTPVRIVQEISASGVYTCAMADNTGWCWGLNSSGQLGNKTSTNAKLPVNVVKSDGTVLTNVVHVIASVNGSHTCAITDTNLLWCWGGNTSGQLGIGTFVNANAAVRVKKSATLTLENVTNVSVGGVHTCAIADRTVYCWGNSVYGETGLGVFSARTNYATTVTNADRTPFTGASEISAGFRHTCAIKAGNVWCWGLDLQGQLGDGSLRVNKVYPVQVIKQDNTALSNVTQISSGSAHTCAMTSTGEMWCWGFNQFGQIGDGTTLDGTVNSSSTPPGRTRAVRVLRSAGVALTGITAIATGGNNSCAVISGAAWCWGLNDKGQLGNGTKTNRLYPVQVISTDGTPLANIDNLSSGVEHTCAVANQKALCWGENSSGQLGDNTIIDKLRAFILGL
jgi:alpha-tubulin suppressor-like RCC1 family protein